MADHPVDAAIRASRRLFPLPEDRLEEKAMRRADLEAFIPPAPAVPSGAHAAEVDRLVRLAEAGIRVVTSALARSLFDDYDRKAGGRWPWPGWVPTAEPCPACLANGVHHAMDGAVNGGEIVAHACRLCRSVIATRCPCGGLLTCDGKCIRACQNKFNRHAFAGSPVLP